MTTRSVVQTECITHPVVVTTETEVYTDGLNRQQYMLTVLLTLECSLQRQKYRLTEYQGGSTD